MWCGRPEGLFVGRPQPCSAVLAVRIAAALLTGRNRIRGPPLEYFHRGRPKRPLPATYLRNMRPSDAGNRQAGAFSVFRQHKVCCFPQGQI